MNKNRKKFSGKKKALIIALSIVLVILIVVGAAWGYSYYVYNKMDNVEINREEVLNENGKKDQYENITNIALFGVDTDDGEGYTGRSDSNMILTINHDKKEIKLCSIMRDTYVNVPGHGNLIINAAMQGGGPELSLKTINTNFDLDIDKFVSVNISSLPKVIDKIGGLDIEITSDELKFINSYIDNINTRNKTNVAHIQKAGKQHLNGTQATAYCRIRYTEGNDYKRTERQRTVIGLIATKLSNMPMGELSSTVMDILPLVSTNLSYTEIVSIGTDVLSIGTGNILQDRFPHDEDSWSEGMNGDFGAYRLMWNKEATIEKMHEFIYN